MAIVTTDSKHYSNIADAIREKTGEATTYKPEEMADGVAEVHEAGKQAEHEEFWDEVLKNDDWSCKFYGSSWSDKTFRPTKDIKPVGYAYNMFYLSWIGDLVKILKDAGVTLDVSGVTRADGFFAWCTKLTTVPYLDFRNATFGNPTTSAMFNYDSRLHTIEGLHVGENTTFNSSTFGQCTALENLTIYGTIGQSGLYLAYSNKLTHDSLMSVINALADKSGTGTAWTVTLGATNLAKLTDAEKAIATQKGWTLA
jgi:hypothetical protein